MKLHEQDEKIRAQKEAWLLRVTGTHHLPQKMRPVQQKLAEEEGDRRERDTRFGCPARVCK